MFKDELTLLAERISENECDHVFTLYPDGSITHPKGVYAPSVYHDDEDDIHMDGPGWRALKGLTGQYAYNGACMHASEYIGRGIAEVMLEMVVDNEGPMTWVWTTVEVMPDDEDEFPEPAGWAILYREES
jgi:hypothetical protein